MRLPIVISMMGVLFATSMTFTHEPSFEFEVSPPVSDKTEDYPAAILDSSQVPSDLPLDGVPIGGVLSWIPPRTDIPAEEQLPEGFRFCFGPEGEDDPITPLFDETRIPDLRDRFIMGVNEHALGETGGTAQRPSHSHNHGGYTGYTEGGPGVLWYPTDREMGRENRHRHSISTYTHRHETSDGSENLPPYHGVFMIIRATSASVKEDASLKQTEKATLPYSDVPVGSILPWVTPLGDLSVCEQVPPGFICVSENCENGTESPTRLPALSRIPDLNNRFLMGADETTLETEGGKADIPAEGAHNHGGATALSGKVDCGAFENTVQYRHNHTISSEPSHDHGGENRPPYLGLLMLMRVEEGKSLPPEKLQEHLTQGKNSKEQCLQNATFVPVGSIISWIPPKPVYEASIDLQLPIGYLECAGPRVQDDIATPYDEKEIPDLLGRFLKGVGVSSEVGSQGGREDIPYDTNHAHTTGQTNIFHGTATWGESEFCVPDNHNHNIYADGEHNHGGENRPPFYAVVMLIKVGGYPGAYTVDFDGDGIPDATQDFNGNGTADAQEDFNDNGIPDAFELDYNCNEIPDVFEFGWLNGVFTYYNGTEKPDALGLDCDGNGIPDAFEDFNGNGIPDAFEDFNKDSKGIPDAFENFNNDDKKIPDAFELDYNNNGKPDVFEFRWLHGVFTDFSGTGTPDSYEINISGTLIPDVFEDFNGNNIPDAFEDFNGNSIPDTFEDFDEDPKRIPDAFQDFNNDSNKIPDAFEDFNGNDRPDAFELTYNNNSIPDVFEFRWLKGVFTDFDGNGTPDAYEINVNKNTIPDVFEDFNNDPENIPDAFEDFNGNGIPDAFEDFNGDPEHIPDAFEDFNNNGDPEAFEIDIKGNGIPDVFEFRWLKGVFTDFNGNGIPDGLEDFNKNGIPDAFEDFNRNGIPDAFEDFNGNGIPDIFEMDFNGNSVPDLFEYGWIDGLLSDFNNNGLWDAFEDSDDNGTLDLLEDRNQDGFPDIFEQRDENGFPAALVTLPGSDRPIAFLDPDGNGILNIVESAAFNSELLRYALREQQAVLEHAVRDVFQASMPWVSGSFDLALHEDKTAASSAYWLGSSLTEWLANPFDDSGNSPVSMGLLPGLSGPARVDATGEPRGYIMGGTDGRIRFYNNMQNGIDGSVSVQEYGAYSGLIDVAGLAHGRAAALAARSVAAGADVLVLERLLRASGVGYQRCSETPVAVLSLPDTETALAVAGYRSGGLAVLTEQRVISVASSYPTDPALWKSFPLTEAAAAASRSSLAPLDLAIDKDENVLVLCGDTEALNAARLVMCLRDFGSVAQWTPLNLNETGNDSSAIAAFMTPEGLSYTPTPPIPWDPPLPDPPPDQPNREVLGDIPVDATGFDTADGWRWANAGQVSLFPFLSLNVDGINGGNFLRWRLDSPDILEGFGALGLDWELSDFSGLFPDGLSLPAGAFRVNTQTGEIIRTDGSKWVITLPVLGQVQFEKLWFMGRGSAYGAGTPPTGVVFEAGVSTNDAPGGLGKWKIPRLFLGDFGGLFRMTFGMPGLAGLMPPYTSGNLGFNIPDIVSLTTSGETFTSNAISFESLVLRLGSEANPVFRLTLDDFWITRDEITFGRSFTELAGVMDLVITQGRVSAGGSGKGWKSSGPGVYAESVSTLIRATGQEITNVHNLYIGPCGVSFDNKVGFKLGGLQADLENLAYERCGAQDDTLTMDRAEITVSGLKAWLAGVRIPLNGALPKATGGAIGSSNPITDAIRLELNGELKFSSSEISIPKILLVWPGYEVDFPGGRITRSSVEIFDAPPLEVMGVLVDLELARFSKNEGFFTSQAYVGFGDLAVTLRDLAIGNGGLRIGGGGFNAFGFGVDISSSTPSNAPATAWCLDATVSGIPVFGQAGMGFCVDGSRVDINSVRLPNVTQGPLRVRNGELRKQGNELYGSALVGFGALPDMNGHVILESGKLKELGLGLVFSRPSYPAGGFILVAGPGGIPLVLLNSIHGTVWPAEMTVRADASLCLFMTVPIPLLGERALIGANGSVVVSGQGYVRADAGVLLFPKMDTNTGSWTGGLDISGGTLIAGRVYRDGSYRGTGMWGQGYLDFLGCITARGENWAYINNRDIGGILDGTLKVPGWVPIIGGTSFAGTRVTLRNASFRGDVWFEICTPPIYYPCGVKWCQKCKWGVCVGYPCGVEICEFRYCPKFRFGVTIDDRGVHTKRDEKGFQTFDGGYASGSGMRVLTNYRMLAEKYALSDGIKSTDPGTDWDVVIPIDLGGKSGELLDMGEMVFRYETAYAGQEIHASLRFPDGRVFTRHDVPALGTKSVPAKPKEGDILINYQYSRYTDPETHQERQESAFICKGPYAFKPLEVLNEDGEPTGDVEQVFGPGNLHAGRYELFVQENKGADGKLDVLAANDLPEVTYARMEPLDQEASGKYKVSWRISDPNGDDVTVRVHLAPDPENLENSFVVGNAAGLPSKSNEGTCEFDLNNPDIASLHLTGTLYVLLSLEDLPNKEDDTPDTRQFFGVGVINALPPPNSPPKVQEVVAVAVDGAAEVYWQSDMWENKADNLDLVAFAVTAEELGPEGTTGPPISVVVPAVHTVQQVDQEGKADGEPQQMPVVEEASLNGLINGRKYRLTVAPIAHETTVDKNGDIRVEENPGEPSDAWLIMPYGKGNNAPRFISQAPPVAILDTTYRYLIRLEDLDNNLEDIRLASMVPIIPEGEIPAKAEVVFPDLYLGPTENHYEWELVLTPTLAKSLEIVGQWMITLEAWDGHENVATQTFVLDVAAHANASLHASFISQPDLTVYAGERFDYQPAVSGLPEDYPAAFSLLEAPEGMEIDSQTGLITWIPGVDDVGPHRVMLTMGERGLEQDSAGGCKTCGPITYGFAAVTQTFTLTVLNNPYADYFPVISVTPAVTTVGPAAATLVFEVTNIGSGNLDWIPEVLNGMDWMTISGMDVASGFLAVDVADNPLFVRRMGTLRIRCADDGCAAYELTVHQRERLALLVDPLRIDLPSNGGLVDVSVLCQTPPCNWTVEAALGAEWLAIRQKSAGLQVLCEENHSVATRYGILHVIPDIGNIIEIPVVQKGGEPLSLAVSPLTQQVETIGGIAAFSVATDASWYASCSTPWLQLADASGSAGGMFTATALPNEGLEERIAPITITGIGTTPVSITVSAVQPAPVFGLAVTPAAQEVEATGGSTTFTVTTDAAWEAAPGASWVIVSPSSGTGNALVTATYEANTGSARSAVITVTGAGTTPASVTFNLNQAAASGVTISGKVSRADGAPEPNVTLTADGVGVTAATDTNGNYLLTVPAGFTGKVTPSKTGFSFDPASRSYDKVTANQTDQHYTARACESAPPAPTNLAAASVPETSGRIDLVWEGSEGATGYKVYRRVAGTEDAFEPIGVTTTTMYIDSEAPPGDLNFSTRGCMSSTMDCMGCINSEANPGCYTEEPVLGPDVEYQVTAVNDCGESEPSNIANAAAWKKFKFLMATIVNGDVLLFLAVAAAVVLTGRRLRYRGPGYHQAPGK